MYKCFVDLEKAYDPISRNKLLEELLEYDMRGQLLAVIKLLYKQTEVCVHVISMKTKPFSVSVGLQQGCIFSPLLFITYMNMNKIDKGSSSSSGITLECAVWCLLFADNLALLCSNISHLQYAIDWFSDACLDEN